ncbi:hypothetical protein CY34DRAFT_109091 [Suillus luteus UH-Slu-Lm8-n1]|uniref:Uncharacterized protein n=1 Tax=Suillus luteus UH-Slu-Lm8-n1 TaxID=930992 RepID=A0A0D0AH31_9AGAM|nr:hypothetical protein CY34DRAFT_109091 [Suillus luteus UH-Slu-Lm8-n1]
MYQLIPTLQNQRKMLQSDDIPLAAELQQCWTHLQSVNTWHLWHIERIFELPGYNGPMGPGTRKGQTEIVSPPPPHQLPQDQDDIGKGDADEKAFRQLEDVHTYFEGLDHHRVDLELCTVLNSLTGGSTIILHHPAVTSPNADIVPESLKAEVYINPRVLAEHQELHPVLAQIMQTFIANYATPLAHVFAVTCNRKWGKSNSQQTPLKDKATPFKGKEKIESILPLVPSLVAPNSVHFVFHGCPVGSLESLLNSSSHILSYAPSYDGNIIWEPTQVQIRHACDNNSGGSAMKRAVTFVPPPSLVTYSISEPQTSCVSTLVSFGKRTEAALEELGYPNKQYLTKNWVMKLQELTEIPKIQLILNYINAKATDLAAKFKKPRHQYLERFSLDSIVHHRKHHKTSIEANSSANKKLNISELVKKASNYHELTDQQKEELVIEFYKVKKGPQDRPPNITARTRAPECAHSFQFVREELEALNKCVGAEAFVVMVHDIAKMATDFKSTVLANGLIINTASNHREHVAKAKTAIHIGLHASLCEVTDDSSVTIEFTRYNDLLCDYHVKLVGWNHPQWANTSDLQGGIESLEKVASAIAEGTYKDDSGPPPIENKNPSGPLLKDNNDSGPPSFENENDSGLSPTHTSSITDDLVDPALCMLDNSSTMPVEHLPSQSDSTTCSQPQIPTPSQPQPCAMSSPPPANEYALVSMTNHNHKRPVDDFTPSEGQRPKRACKLTEKAQQPCSLDSDSHETDKVQQRKAKGGQCTKKSKAVIDSDRENTM